MLEPEGAAFSSSPLSRGQRDGCENGRQLQSSTRSDGIHAHACKFAASHIVRPHREQGLRSMVVDLHPIPHSSPKAAGQLPDFGFVASVANRRFRLRIIDGIRSRLRKLGLGPILAVAQPPLWIRSPRRAKSKRPDTAPPYPSAHVLSSAGALPPVGAAVAPPDQRNLLSSKGRTSQIASSRGTPMGMGRSSGEGGLG